MEPAPLKKITGVLGIRPLEQDLPEEFELMVRAINCRRYFLSVGKYHTVESLKEMIHDKDGIPPGCANLICGQQLLGDGETLGSLGINKDSQVYIILKSI